MPQEWPFSPALPRTCCIPLPACATLLGMKPSPSPDSYLPVIEERIQRHIDKHATPPSAGDLYRRYLRRWVSRDEIDAALLHLASIGRVRRIHPSIDGRSNMPVRYTIRKCEDPYLSKPNPGCSDYVMNAMRRWRSDRRRFGGASASDLQDNYLKRRYSTAQVEAALAVLLADGRVLVVDPESPPLGRPTTRYAINQDFGL